MDDSIRSRIRRIYAAIGDNEETDLQNLRATVIRTKTINGVCQDFSGGDSDEQLANDVHTVIHNIANLRDHLKRWAKHHRQDKAQVDQAISKCSELQIVLDLSNNDKHGYPPRQCHHSGSPPKLIKIRRRLVLQTQAQKNSCIVYTLGANGTQEVIGDGLAKAIVTADVVDGEGNRIGDLFDIANKAVTAWERLLAEFGALAARSGNESTADGDQG